MDVNMTNREAYDACVKDSQEKHHWATYWALVEDGYDPNIDWISMLEKWRRYS